MIPKVIQQKSPLHMSDLIERASKLPLYDAAYLLWIYKGNLIIWMLPLTNDQSQALGR